MRRPRDVGDTLIEILLTVVILSLTITALLASLATAGNAGNVQRNSVQADLVLRNYAEATKAATQGCIAAAGYTVVFTPPTGFTATSVPTTTTCPAVTTPRLVQLVVTGPLGLRETLQIKVATP
jgi:type II secretory pathway pseudopilin PulG